MKLKNRLYIFISILGFLTLFGCSPADSDMLADKEKSDTDEIELTVLTKLRDVSQDIESERMVRTLRLIIFDQAGNIVFNKQYLDAGEALTQENGSFRIHERIPGGLDAVQICLIANEPLRWKLDRKADDPDGPITYQRLKNKTIDYTQDYKGIISEPSGRFMDISILESGIIMFAEKNVTLVKGSSMLFIPLDLVRTLAKVMLTLSYDQSDLAGVDFENGDSFVLSSAAVDHQPVLSFLTPKIYDSENNPQLSSQSIELLSESGNSVVKTKPLIFYIPEHILSAESIKEGGFTHLNILGQFTPSGGTPIVVRYTIPLGDGMQKSFTNPGYIPSKEDYAITRNHYYKVEGIIRKLGEFDGVTLSCRVADWSSGEIIDINRPAPYLNVSEIYSDIELTAEDLSFTGVRTDKLFYWTNQQQSYLHIEDLIVDVYQGDENKGALSLCFPGAQMNCTLKKYTTDSDGFFENNGCIQLDLSLPETDLSGCRIEVSFKLRAANLTRSIKIIYRKRI